MRAFWKRPRKANIKAVDESDFAKFLERLGVADLRAVNAKCYRCGRAVSENDIDAVFPQDGKVQFICSNKKCSLSEDGIAGG